ncbi:MAG: hypothetical protein IH830_05060 [Planctomycetes bacterium]|nr:hypothetical protein [Planctomycetota bacterium]
MMSASNVVYEVTDRVEATAWGGVAAMHQLAHTIGLTQALDDKVHVLKIHKPYHESDHILNIALNILAGGTRLEDLELRRRDAVKIIDGIVAAEKMGAARHVMALIGRPTHTDSRATSMRSVCQLLQSRGQLGAHAGHQLAVLRRQGRPTGGHFLPLRPPSLPVGAHMRARAGLIGCGVMFASA